MNDRKNFLKIRQICFMFIAFLPVTKFAVFPCFISEIAGEGLWIAALIGFIVDFGVLSVALYLSKKHGDKTLFEIVSGAFGDIPAKILFAIFAIFFFLKASLPILEQKVYIERTLYEVMPKPFIFYPLFIVSFYACLKGLKIFGRIADITVGVTVTAYIAAMFLSVTSADFSNLLPLFKKPVYNLVNAAFRSILWHSDGIYFLMMPGSFKKEKHYAKKIAFSYLGAALSVVFFVAVFYAIYGPVSPSQTFALPSMMVFSVNATNAGRFDFIAVFLFLFSQIFAIIIPLYFCADSLKTAFGFKSRLVPSVVVNAALALLSFFLGNRFQAALDMSAEYLSYFILIVSVGGSLLLTLVPKRSENEIAEG